MFDETRSRPLSPGEIEEAIRGLDDQSARSSVALSVPGFQIIRELYRGGQGVVYLALQTSPRRAVAVKVLLERGGSDRTARKRFLQEIQLIAKLQHPHIVKVIVSGETPEGRLYYVMEYVPGIPLRAYVREHQLDLEAVLRLFVLLSDTVEELHRRGIVHRDLKPSNVLVKPNGQLVLLDLGLAMNLSADVETILSQPGDLLGTLAYMSPEQAAMTGEELDSRSDVYSLGVMLYEILTGVLPCSTKGALDVVLQRIRESPPVPMRAAWTAEHGTKAGASEVERDKFCPLGPELETIVQTCMAKERSRRYRSAGDLGEDLRRYLRGDPIAARAEGVIGAAVSHLRRQIRRHRAGAVTLVCIFATVGAAWLTHSTLYRAARLDQSYERWMIGTVLPKPIPQSLDQVRVIAVTDSTDIDGLASRFGYADVSNADVISWRRLHGRLMSHLADSGCKAVIWDVMFTKESSFDQSFLEGVRELKRAGIPVVVATERWWSGDMDLGVVSPSIAAETRWGCLSILLNVSDPWGVPVVAHKVTDETLGSLAMEGVVAARHRFSIPEYQLDLDNSVARITARMERFSEDRPWWPGVEIIPLDTAVIFDKTNKPPKGFGLDDGDAAGFVHFPMSADAELEAATIEYAHVFSERPQELRHNFGNRLVVVGNLKGGRDRYGYSDGRILTGLHAHAVAMESLMRNLVVRLPSWWECMIGAAVGSFGGCAIALKSRHGVVRNAVWVLGVMVGLLIATLIAGRAVRWIVNPASLFIGMIFSLGLCAFVRRTTGQPHRID